MELQQDDGPRSSVGIGSGSDDAVRSRQSSLGDSSKGSGNSLGTRREIAGRRPENSVQECRRLPDWREIRKVEGTTFVKILVGKPSVSSECTATTQAFGRLTHLGPTGKSPVP
ncbi:hypothetical protein B296_00045208 [Ensete ventricosum]|uniref:Uncharacterized protein n=1 Tax=Ensete ventricosum TaxID=4639 RepID=A0A426XWQ3_ENSVE|nr:hypothetical protein B296_00045208 [Ensete ventricosum]